MIPKTMTAAVIDSLGSWPTLREVPVPEPGAGQALVRVEASGICHTDVHLSAGETAVDEVLPPFPIIPGHEGAGEVARLGPGVAGLEVGDRVVIGWLGGACGECTECRSGSENLCRFPHNPGNNYDGTLAEYALVWARSAGRIPNGLEAAEAGPLGCAGVTAYAATVRARIKPGDVVGVVGVGGLGHLAVQYAQLAGARVVAIDLTEERLELAAALGAELCLNAKRDDVVGGVAELGGAEAMLLFVSNAESVSMAVRSVRRAGRIVLLGWPATDPVAVPLGALIENGIELIGSDGGTRRDLERTLALHAQGRATVHREERPLSDVRQAFEDVHAGRAAQPRIVIRIATA